LRHNISPTDQLREEFETQHFTNRPTVGGVWDTTFHQLWEEFETQHFTNCGRSLRHYISPTV